MTRDEIIAVLRRHSQGIRTGTDLRQTPYEVVSRSNFGPVADDIITALSAPVAVTSEETMRAEFERWYSNDGEHLRAVERDGDASYKLMGAHHSWQAWQAAWRSAAEQFAAAAKAAHPDVPEPVYKAVERILDDNSAWIARPNDEVTKKVALAATIAAHSVVAAMADHDAAAPKASAPEGEWVSDKEYWEAPTQPAVTDAVLAEREACAKIARDHIGAAKRERLAKGLKLDRITPDALDSILDEERGEDIAATIIENAIRARSVSAPEEE